jgi:hypothetical protein
MTQLGQVTESSIAHLERILYTAKAHTTGGRDGGASRHERDAIERSAGMSSVLIFTAKWKKWYRLLRYRKGFGLFDSVRLSLWLARS